MGGVSMFGGVGDIPGALLGVLFLSFLSNGFSFLNYAPQVNEIVTGAILVIAVALDQGVRRSVRRRRTWARAEAPQTGLKNGETDGAEGVPVP
jgi:ribose/xylose/arabinose/galactoside ABC-type transport system permease subunit